MNYLVNRFSGPIYGLVIIFSYAALVLGALS
jgi:hypothetical protein